VCRKFRGKNSGAEKNLNAFKKKLKIRLIKFKAPSRNKKFFYESEILRRKFLSRCVRENSAEKNKKSGSKKSKPLSVKIILP
jgi:REP element-mobilizing transposase RayT